MRLLPSDPASLEGQFCALAFPPSLREHFNATASARAASPGSRWRPAPRARDTCGVPFLRGRPAACMPAQRDGEAGASLARGGASAGATQSPPLPPPPLLPLRLHQAAFLLSTASLVIINSKHGCNDLLALILSALAHSVCTSFMLLAPRQYWQHR